MPRAGAGNSQAIWENQTCVQRGSHRAIHRLESIQLHLNDTSTEPGPSPARHSLPLIHSCPSTFTNLFFISVLCDVETVTGMESYNMQAFITIFTKHNVLKCILSACVNHSHSWLAVYSITQKARVFVHLTILSCFPFPHISPTICHEHFTHKTVSPLKLSVVIRFL